MGGLAGDGGAWSGGRTGAGAATGESATKEKGGTRSARTRRARDGFVTRRQAPGLWALHSLFGWIFHVPAAQAR